MHGRLPRYTNNPPTSLIRMILRILHLRLKLFKTLLDLLNRPRRLRKLREQPLKQVS